MNYRALTLLSWCLSFVLCDVRMVATVIASNPVINESKSPLSSTHLLHVQILLNVIIILAT